MTEPTTDPEPPEGEAWQLAGTVGDLGVTRRKLMVTSAVGAGAASLAGCVSGIGGGDSASGGADDGHAKNYVVTSHVYVTHDVGSFQHTHFAASCAPQYQFVPGQLVGFRVGIWDPETGEQLTNDDVESVRITFDGPTSFDPLDLEWNGDDEEHPAEQWSARLRNTEGAEPGQYKYTIEITDGEANFRNVGIWENTFTILEPGSVATATPTPSGG